MLRSRPWPSFAARVGEHAGGEARAHVHARPLASQQKPRRFAQRPSPSALVSPGA